MTLASLVKPDIVILSAKGFSWLPISGMLIMSLGVLECLDAFLAKEQRDAMTANDSWPKFCCNYQRG